MESLRNYFKNNTCPWWVIGTFDNPLRRLVQRPERILAGLVREGQTALDVGPGMGYFTIPLARMVGERGRVIAADLQPQMLAGLRSRAERARMLQRIETHLASPEQIGVTIPVDFALVFWMLHEVRMPEALLGELFSILKPGGRILLVEPVVHVSKGKFVEEVQLAEKQRFIITKGPAVGFSRSALLTKP